MTLYYETFGQGPAVVLVHGWGLHGGIFAELAAELSRAHRVTVVDLPGHGRSPLDGEMSLAPIADRVAALVPEPATWLGWSLGGFVALDAALRHAPRVARLVLVGATPRFVQAADWTAAMTPETFAQFGAGLGSDYRGTLMRFLSLQAGNDAAGRAVIKRLRGELAAHGEPQPAALAAGLSILERTDLRAELGRVQAPALVLHGGHDRLAPPAAGEYLAAHIPRARFRMLPGGGHAPFLSRPAAFREALGAFLA